MNADTLVLINRIAEEHQERSYRRNGVTHWACSCGATLSYPRWTAMRYHLIAEIARALEAVTAS